MKFSSLSGIFKDFYSSARCFQHKFWVEILYDLTLWLRKMHFEGRFPFLVCPDCLRDNHVLPQSSGRPVFFSASMKSRSGSRPWVSGSFLDIIFVRIEISDWSGGFLSSEWASGSKSPDDWSRIFYLSDLNVGEDISLRLVKTDNSVLHSTKLS